jgi:hypothetical protein
MQMQGIYLAAILTTGIAAAIFVPIIHRLRIPANERLVWLAAAMAVPMQPLAFYLVRVPLDHWLAGQPGSASTTYQWVTSAFERHAFGSISRSDQRGGLSM